MKVKIKPQPLTRADYSRYGNVLVADEEALAHNPANMGSAKRFNHLAEVWNLRDDAKLNLCIFRCSPAAMPLEVKLLEKHEYSTQVFVPMSRDSRYLVLVCLGDDKPDLSTFAAFIAEGAQGISYRPGVWHYPMTALDDQLDFLCLVHENESEDDCQVENLAEPLVVEIP